MKKVIMAMMVPLTLLSGRQLSRAEQYDDPQCFAVCERNYDSCVADVINLPEPRTPQEQQKLDACRQTHDDCQHSCETSNKPVEDQPKQDNQ